MLPHRQGREDPRAETQNRPLTHTNQLPSLPHGSLKNEDPQDSVPRIFERVHTLLPSSAPDPRGVSGVMDPSVVHNPSVQTLPAQE